MQFIVSATCRHSENADGRRGVAVRVPVYTLKTFTAAPQWAGEAGVPAGGFAGPWAGALLLLTWRCLKLEMCGIVPLLTSWQSQEAEVKFVLVGFYFI